MKITLLKIRRNKDNIFDKKYKKFKFQLKFHHEDQNWVLLSEYHLILIIRDNYDTKIFSIINRERYVK
jgi:hypothetical protein